jgi:lipopolysaccharide/colanic/teichoic acid biosynthesis glycosyltransferase
MTGVSKRAFDLTASSCALVVLSPVLAATAVAVRLFIGSPILFRQTRPGLHGEPFEILKFRTMTNARGADGALLPDADRLTRFGRFLRASSLDELPELVNIARGEMSFVGPRPLLMQYLPLYTPEQARRHEVRPGLTGWAQVKGRNSLDWEQKFALDTWYVENRSLWLDLKILALTVRAVVKREGISRDGEATMPVFEGTRE